jgi:hypothetical protein
VSAFFIFSKAACSITVHEYLLFACVSWYNGAQWFAKELAGRVPKTVFEKGEERKATTEDKLLNPKTVKDKKRLEALKDRVKEIVPPNVNTAGNRNVKVKDGKVIFGEDVTQVNKDNCPVPISRARLIQQLTKSSLF